MCLEIHELHPTYFLTAPVLALQTTLKNTKVKLNRSLLQISSHLLKKSLIKNLFFV